MGFQHDKRFINRNGRPPKEETFTRILEEQGEIVDVNTPQGKIARKKAIAVKLWSLALDGDMAAIKYIYDRIDGKPRESYKVDGLGDITYRIIKPDENFDPYIQDIEKAHRETVEAEITRAKR